MPPKAKKDAGAPPPRPVLGRFKGSLKLGILGMPNVGKSTLFNCIGKLSVPAENFPFCTIEPSHARIAVPDDHFKWLCEHWNPGSSVPAHLELVDIAGLVKGAHEGAGLGNEFLANVSAVDGLLQVCRAFSDDDVIHVETTVDPVRDLQIIFDELRMKDLERINKVLPDAEAKLSRAGNKAPADLRLAASTLQKAKHRLEVDKKPIRTGDWSRGEVDELNKLLLLTSKPSIFLVNLSEKDYVRKRNKWLGPVKRWIDEHSENTDLLIPFSASLESKLADIVANDGQEAADAYLKEIGVPSSLDKIIGAGYRALRLMHFYTAGHDEVKCWTVPKGTLAPQAAGAIHTDFEKGFICAEIQHYDDFKELGSESAVKAAGKYRQQGKTYEVQPDDIIFFKFNVASGGKATKK